MPIINNNSEPDAVLSAFHTLTLFNPHNISVSIVHPMLLQLRCVQDGVKMQVLSWQAWGRACHSAFLTSIRCYQYPGPHFERLGCSKGCCCAPFSRFPSCYDVGCCDQHTSAPSLGYCTPLAQAASPGKARRWLPPLGGGLGGHSQ